jgi:hypothetical protein
MPNLSALVCLSTLALVLSSVGVRAGVNDYSDASLYPARVNVMQFNGPMDLHHSVGWREWDVMFDKAQPSAAWKAGDGYHTVTIGPLLCHSTATDDAHYCELEIQFFENGAETNCSVSDTDGTYAVDLSSVNCPSTIELVH